MTSRPSGCRPSGSGSNGNGSSGNRSCGSMLSGNGSSGSRPSGRKGTRRTKMPISERAKQFAPFAATVGLDAALKKKELEHSRCKRIEMTEDSEQALNRQLSELYEGDIISVTYYKKGHYDTVRGEVQEINASRKCLLVDGREIYFKDIYRII